MLRFLTDKAILLISPQPWNHVRISKHHYAEALAGHNNVLFLEPPRREAFAPIHQALLGASDLAFGPAYYRPDRAGYSGRAHVARLADYLGSVEPSQWSAAALARIPSLITVEDREEELEYLRDWFGALQRLYQKARERDRVVVCESI